MEEVLNAFGIDGRLIVIQVFNFALLAGLLWYFLYTPVMNLLAERQRKIEAGLKDAEAAAESRQAANSERQKIVSDAQREAEEISARARSYADEKASTILAAANDKAEHVLSDAERKAEEAKKREQQKCEAEIAQTAILAAEKILRERSS